MAVRGILWAALWDILVVYSIFWACVVWSADAAGIPALWGVLRFYFTGARAVVSASACINHAILVELNKQNIIIIINYILLEKMNRMVLRRVVCVIVVQSVWLSGWPDSKAVFVCTSCAWPYLHNRVARANINRLFYATVAFLLNSCNRLTNFCWTAANLHAYWRCSLWSV